MEQSDTENDVAKTLYATPAGARRETNEEMVANLMRTPDAASAEEETRELLMQVSQSGNRLAPDDPRVANNSSGVQSY